MKANIQGDSRSQTWDLTSLQVTPGHLQGHFRSQARVANLNSHCPMLVAQTSTNIMNPQNNIPNTCTVEFNA